MAKYLMLLGVCLPNFIAMEQLPNPYIDTPVYNQILRAKPGIDSDYALKLTKSIYEVAGAFKIEPRVLTAILAQESMFNPLAVNQKTKDYGLAQINHKTAKAYRFNLLKLKRDPCYSIWAAGVVLKDFKKAYKKERDFWTRYNSSKPDKRQEYKQLVARYL